MRVYNKRFIQKLQSRVHNQLAAFVPFPGKYPTRLYACVSVIKPLTGERISRFSYNGAYCPSVLRKIKRLVTHMQDGRIENIPHVEIFEYHKKGVIYAGNLFGGSTYAGHNKVHFTSRHTNLDPRRTSNQELEPEISVKCGSFYMLVPAGFIPTVDDKQILLDFKREMRERYTVNEVR